MNFQLLVITLILLSGFVGSAFAQITMTVDGNVVKQLMGYDDVGDPIFVEKPLDDLLDEMSGKGVIFNTQEGSFMIELFPEDAPIHVYRFLELVKSGYYEGIIFHRIIPGFMIQGGDPNTKDPESDRATWGSGGPGYSIDNEFNTIKHVRGIVSMARQAGADTAGSQFFIVQRNSPQLDGEYTVFGRLVPGTYSTYNLDQIAKLDTDAGDAPIDVSKAKILKTQIINFSGEGIVQPPERLDSITRPISTAGGTVMEYTSEKYGVTFNLPYRWDAVETSDVFLKLRLEPNKLNHSAAQAVKESGFVPQIFISQEERGSKMLAPNFVVDPSSFFSIKGGEEPKFLNNNLFENDDERWAHLVTSTQMVQTPTEPVKFKIIQIHFTNLETNYSVIYVNTDDYFRYEINAFVQAVEDFKIMIDGSDHPINFTNSDIFRQIIADGKQKPLPEPEPPVRIGGCLIATASYGSELAPQVQQLRELRDNTVLQTKSGSMFMAGFNQFYYSFSPMIADYERENPAFREAVKLTITPLLASLTLLQHTGIDSEYEMLGYGISIILLNIGMYIIAPAVLIMKIRSFYKLQ